MAGVEDAPQVEVVLVIGRHVVPLDLVDADLCDLGLVDELARLQLAARRLGGSIYLSVVRDDLRELLHLVGLGGCIGT